MIINKIIRLICPTLVIFLFLGSFLVPVQAFDVFLGTHERKTFSNFSGRMLERVINREINGINCRVIPGSGDIHNLTNLLQGSLDIALINSRMLYDAVNKKGNFKFLDINYQNLNVIAPFYGVPITLIAGKNTSIKKLGDLKGKRINIGAPLSLQRLSFNRIFAAKSWSKGDFSLVAEISDSLSQDTMALCHGSIDAMIHIGVHPDSSVRQLLRLCQASFAAMNDNDIAQLVKSSPAFFKFNIPSGTYPSQNQDIITFGTQTLIVASQNLDKKTVYIILDAMYKGRLRLSAAHPALGFKKPDIQEMTDAGIKLHEGAIDYFSGNK